MYFVTPEDLEKHKDEFDEADNALEDDQLNMWASRLFRSKSDAQGNRAKDEARVRHSMAAWKATAQKGEAWKQQSLPRTDERKNVPPLKIVILIVGSRGDVQPFIAFGKGDHL